MNKQSEYYYRHKEEYLAKAKERRERYKKEHRCVVCGCDLPENCTSFRCFDCRVRQTAANERRKNERESGVDARVELNERKAKMIEMQKNGSTYEEIGKAFNLSKQRVFQIIGGELRIKFKTITPDECIYPNLRKWMNDNCITRAELSRRAFGNSHPVILNSVSAFLKGRSRDIRKSTIDKYLIVAGLTYEELFETEGEDNEQRETD